MFKMMLKVYDFTFLQKTWIDPVKRCMRIVNCNVSYNGTQPICQTLLLFFGLLLTIDIRHAARRR